LIRAIRGLDGGLAVSGAILEKLELAEAAMKTVTDAGLYIKSITRKMNVVKADDDYPHMMAWRAILVNSKNSWLPDAIEALRRTPTIKGKPRGRSKKKDSIEGREWHESKEYFGGGEELTREAAQAALAKKDTKTLKRLFLSVNAAPDVVLAILRSDSNEYSYLLKQHPRLLDLVQEEPRILAAITDGVFQRLVTEANRGRQRDQLLGPPVAKLTFKRQLVKLRGSGSDGRELANLWPISLELFACGALCRVSKFDEDQDGPRYWQTLEEGMAHIYMELESYYYFHNTFKEITKFIEKKNDANESITPQEQWNMLAKYADPPQTKLP
jgi:hypothetical protein